jgi:AcrR family transcriptional regulator
VFKRLRNDGSGEDESYQVKQFCWSERRFHDMTLRNVTSMKRQVPFVISPPTSLSPEPSSNAPLFACDEVLFNRPFPVPRKKSASARPRTGNRRNPVLHQAIIAAATEVLAKEGPTRFTIEAVAKLAGCGKPTIYRWWPSRPALLLEVYEQMVQHELVPGEGKDLATDLATNLRRVWRLWRKDSLGSMYRLILSEMILDKEGVRYLREVFFPRRQAFIAIAFQTAKDRGEIPQDVDIKFLMDLFFGYSLFRLITHQIDDDEIPDRISATIAKLAHSGISNPVRTQHSKKTSVKTKTSPFTPS